MPERDRRRNRGAPRGRFVLPFPGRGIHRRFGFEQQPQSTTPDALNVRGLGVGVTAVGDSPDLPEARVRGGVRPGLGLANGTRLGGQREIGLADPNAGTPGIDFDVFERRISLLETMMVSRDQRQQEWSDDFARRNLSEDWIEATGFVPTGADPAELDWRPRSFPRNGREFKFDNHPARRGAFFDNWEFPDYIENPYELSLYIFPWLRTLSDGDGGYSRGQYYGAHYLFAFMDSVAPDIAMNGLKLEFRATTTFGGFILRLVAVINGEETVLEEAEETYNDEEPRAGRFGLIVSPTRVETDDGIQTTFRLRASWLPELDDPEDPLEDPRGVLGSVWPGWPPWESNVNYPVGWIANYEGVLYRCIETTNTGVLPTSTEPLKWVESRPSMFGFGLEALSHADYVGEYEAGRTYSAGDVVGDGEADVALWESLVDDNMSEDEASVALTEGANWTAATEQEQLKGGRVFAEEIGLIFQSQRFESFDAQIAVVASANGKVYREVDNIFRFHEAGHTSADSGSPGTVGLGIDPLIMGTDREGVLYIADVDVVFDSTEVPGPGRVFGDVVAGKLDEMQIDFTADMGDFNEIFQIGDLNNLDLASFVLVVKNPTGSALKPGSYGILQIEDGRILVDREFGGSGTCDFTIERSPKKYTLSLDKLERWDVDEYDNGDRKGEVPTGCPIIAHYRDRIVLAKENRWFMSRQGDPYDWDFAKDDAGAAVSGELSEAGGIGRFITAVAPHSDDYLIFATASELWLLEGDPSYGGQLKPLSRQIGIVGRRAWAYGPLGEFMFMSSDGLYLLNPGPGIYPLPISRDVLGDDFRLGVATFGLEAIRISDRVEWLLRYDVRYAMVHIYKTDKARAEGSYEAPEGFSESIWPIQQDHWWFDVSSQAFWRVQIPVDSEPTAITSVNERWSEDSPVLLGGRDGWVRTYRELYFVDNPAFSEFLFPGTPREERLLFDASGEDVEQAEEEHIESYVKIGPIRPGAGGVEAALTELTAVLAMGSANVNWSLQVGDSVEQAFRAPVFTSGQFRAGANYNFHPRARGKAIWVVIWGIEKEDLGEDFPWQMEYVEGVVTQAGRQRLY